METRLSRVELDRLCLSIGFKHEFSVECKGDGHGRAGGLSLLWNEEIEIQIRSHSPNHIGGTCCMVADEESWDFARIYGFPEEHNKCNT